MRAERRKRATRVGAKVRYARLGRGATKRWGAAGARWAAARGRGLEDDRVRLGAACSCERESGGALEGARGAERRESDTRAGVRVRYARLGARRGCAVGGGAWAWAWVGGRSGEVGCSVLVGACWD